MEINTAIVLAAGSGSRMKSKVAKQYLMLKDKPVLWYAIKAFEESEIIDRIVLVVGEGEISYCQETIVNAYGFNKVMAVIEGGAQRYLSVNAAIKWLEENIADEEGYIFIHDGARPFVDDGIIKNTYAGAKEFGACVAGMPVKDTIKIVNEAGFAEQTPARRMVWAVQTPQVFERKLIVEAYRSLIKQLEEIIMQGIEITDDAMVVETILKKQVKLVEASYRNIKITTPEDMLIATGFLNNDFCE